jgi:hypothetical protein
VVDEMMQAKGSPGDRSILHCMLLMQVEQSIVCKQSLVLKLTDLNR